MGCTPWFLYLPAKGRQLRPQPWRRYRWLGGRTTAGWAHSAGLPARRPRPAAGFLAPCTPRAGRAADRPEYPPVKSTGVRETGLCLAASETPRQVAGKSSKPRPSRVRKPGPADKGQSRGPLPPGEERRKAAKTAPRKRRPPRQRSRQGCGTASARPASPVISLSKFCKLCPKT
jgi:hypothetical protein